MSLTTRIVKNSLFLSLATVADRVAELVLFVLLARALGPGFVGDYKTVIMYLRIFQNLADFGLTQLVMREVAILDDRREAGTLLMNYGFAGLCLAVVLAMAMAITARLVSYPPPLMLSIYVVSLALLPGAWRRVAEATLTGMESMKYIALISILGGVARVILSWLAFWHGGGLVSIIAVVVLTQAAVVPAYMWVIHRFLVPMRLRPDLSYVKHTAQQIGTFFVMGILLMGVGTQLDVIMVHKIASSEQAGFYSAASAAVQTILMLHPPIIQAAFPSMSLFFKTALPRFQALTIAMLRVFVVALLPIPFLTLLLAKPLMPLFFGERFVESALPLQVLIWIILPSFIYATFARVLIAGNQEQVNVRVAGACTILGVALNLLFIPLWGAPGAALASVLAMSTAASVSYGIISHKLFPLPFIEIVGKPLFCVLVPAAAGFILRDVAFWITIPILLAVYLLLLFWTKALPPEIIGFLRRGIGRAPTRIENA